MDDERSQKLAKVRNLLNEKSLDAIVIQKVNNFAWLTCGASSYIDTTSSQGTASLVVTQDKTWLVTDTIEAPRYINEEGLADQGWEVVQKDWFDPSDAVTGVLPGSRVGSDGFYPGVNLTRELIKMRCQLLPVEQDRVREVARLSADAMQAAVSQIKPGQTEFEIAAILGAETQKRGLLPSVNLIATDERISSFRHPLPTAKKVEKYAMLVLCGRKYGLVISITRLVHFGPLPDDLRKKMNAVAFIDAEMILATQPGKTLKDVFAVAQQAYAQVGYPEEWRLHHQGGIAGYLPRDVVATPTEETVVYDGQAYAWNPSITGAKSEDTILVTNRGYEIVTQVKDWPIIDIEINGQVVHRPAIQEVL